MSTGPNNRSKTEEAPSAWRAYLPAIFSFVLLLGGIAIDQLAPQWWVQPWWRLVWYLVTYLPVGLPVLVKALKAIAKGDVFSEFFLMSLATIGAFFIKEYPEGVAVMLFYAVGELFQDAAVDRAKRNIQALLDVRPDTANVIRDGDVLEVPAAEVQVGAIIRIRVGDRVPLDGKLLSEKASFDTAALTGESVPRTLLKDATVLAGMIATDRVVEMEVTKPFGESSLAQLLAFERSLDAIALPPIGFPSACRSSRLGSIAAAAGRRAVSGQHLHHGLSGLSLGRVGCRGGFRGGLG